VIDRQRAGWLAFLALASAWIAAVAAMAALPVSASAVALARSGDASPRAALVLAWLAGTAAAAALVYAAACALVARALRRQRPWARGGAIALAAVNLLLPPFGTAHGAYALWILLRAPASADDTDEDNDDHR
jgi:hypothetical protein